MPLIAQALTTMASVRDYLNLFTLTAVTSTETLTTNTAATTFSFAHTDLAPNYFGVFQQLGTATAVATASDTIFTASMTIDYDAGTTTFSATMTGVLTVTSYKYLAWDYSQDKLLERLINSASNMVSNYCNRKFIADTYDEFYQGTGRQKLVLKQFPVNFISSVKYASALYTAGVDYVTSDRTYLDYGIVFRDTAWVWYGFLTGFVGELTGPLSNIEVIYSAGYTLQPASAKTLPWDLENAVLSIVATSYNLQQSQALGLKQMTQGKLVYIWNEQQLLQQFSGQLDTFRKAVF